MNDLGLLPYYLGVEVLQQTNNIFIIQCKYEYEILKKIGMEYCKSVLTSIGKNLKLSKFEGGDL